MKARSEGAARGGGHGLEGTGSSWTAESKGIRLFVGMGRVERKGGWGERERRGGRGGEGGGGREKEG